LRTRAIPERLKGVFTTRCYTNPRSPLPLPGVLCWRKVGLLVIHKVVDIYTSLLVHRLIPCTVTEVLTAFTSIKFRLHLPSLQNSLLLSLLSYKWHWCADSATYLIVVVKVH